MNTWKVEANTVTSSNGGILPLADYELSQIQGGLGLAPDWAGAVVGAGAGAVLGVRFGAVGGFAGAGIGLALGAAIGFGYSLATGSGGGGAKRYSGLHKHR